MPTTSGRNNLIILKNLSAPQSHIHLKILEQQKTHHCTLYYAQTDLTYTWYELHAILYAKNTQLNGGMWCNEETRDSQCVLFVDNVDLKNYLTLVDRKLWRHPMCLSYFRGRKKS